MSDCLLSQTITILGHSAMPLEKIITTAFVDGLHPQKLGREVYHILIQLCLNRMSPGGGVRVHTCGRRLKHRYPSKHYSNPLSLLGRGSPVKAFRGKSTHTPVSNPSPMICKETQQTYWLPRVNYGIIMSQFVAGTLGKGMDVVCLLLCWEHKGSCSQRTQEPGMLNNTRNSPKRRNCLFSTQKTENEHC